MIKLSKIVFIGNTAATLLNFRKELICELVGKDHKVYCLVSDYSKNSKSLIIELGAIPIDSALNSKGINPIADISATIKLSDILREIQPDIVLSNFVKPVIFGTLAAKMAKVPRIIGMIEGLGNAFTCYKEGLTLKAKIIQRIQIMLYKISLPFLDTLIVLNPDDLKDLVYKFNIKVNKSIILGGIGVDLNKFKYTPVINYKPVTFIFIGRLLKEKGIFEYLESAKLVKEKHPESEFLILGEFDTRNPFGLLESELEGYLTAGIVNYLGHVDNVQDYLIKSSVFVLPSYREGVPRSTQEAMAIGRPVITTDVPGCRETVENGVNGFLIPAFDANALANKMLEFIEHPNIINEMGKHSRRIAELKFDINKINNKLIHILDSKQ